MITFAPDLRLQVWGFETFTSECRQSRAQERKDKAGRETGEDAYDRSHLYRKRGRVFPEVGCALDNLSLEVNRLVISLDGDGVFPAAFEGGSYLLAKKAKDRRSLQVEVGLYLEKGATFASLMPEGTSGVGSPDKNDDEEEIRSRLEFRVDGDGPDKCRLGPVTVTRERKYARDFDDGLLYKGGGLDAQRVGGLLKSKCFAEEEVAPTGTELAGRWVPDRGPWKQLSAEGQASVTTTGYQPEHVQSVDRPELFWASTGGGSDQGDGSFSSPIMGLLLRGGYTLRVGPLRSVCDTIARGASGETPDSGDADGFPAMKQAWAVEVGWLVANGRKREVLTIAFDLASMSPLGASRSLEERLPLPR